MKDRYLSQSSHGCIKLSDPISLICICFLPSHLRPQCGNCGEDVVNGSICCNANSDFCIMKSYSSMSKVVMNAKGGDADEDDHHPLPAQFLRLHPRLQKTD